MVLFQVLALYLTISRRWFWGSSFQSRSGDASVAAGYSISPYYLRSSGATSVFEKTTIEKCRTSSPAAIALPVILTTFWFRKQRSDLGEFIDGWITLQLRASSDRHGTPSGTENLTQDLRSFICRQPSSVVPPIICFLVNPSGSKTTFKPTHRLTSSDLPEFHSPEVNPDGSSTGQDDSFASDRKGIGLTQ